MKLPEIFSQRDASWAHIPLGNSSVTIGSHGCLITSYAMVLQYFGRKTNPTMVNNLLIKNGGFDAGGNYYWNTLRNIYDYSQKIVDARSRSLTDDELEEIITTLSVRKIPVILQVDMNPDTAASDMHFVLACGYDNGKVMIADPWTGKVSALSEVYYGSQINSLKRAIYRYVIFEKPGFTAEEEVVVDDVDYKKLYEIESQKVANAIEILKK